MSDKGIDILKAIQDTGEYPKDSDISPVMVVLESQEPIAYEFDATRPVDFSDDISLDEN